MSDFNECAESREFEIGYIQASWQGVIAGKFSTDTAWQPAVDIYAGNENLYALIDLAGIDPDKIKLSISQNHFSIIGYRETENCPQISEGVNCLHMEIQHGKFSRKFMLPEPVNSNNASAHYKNGLLVLILPRFVDKDF